MADNTQTANINQPQYQDWVVNLMKNLQGVGSALQGIAEPNAAASTMNQANQMNSQQPGAFSKGVNKALQEHGYKQASEALQAGVPADHIENHPAVTGQNQPPTVDPKQTLATLLGTMAQQQPQVNNQQPSNQSILGNLPGVSTQQQQIIPPSNPMTSPGYDPTTGNIQEGGFVNRAIRGLAGGGILGALAGLAGPDAGQKMEALGAAQKLKAGQPAEIALPQAEAQLAGSQSAEIAQKMAGATPVQKADILKMNRETYGNEITANSEAMKNKTQQYADLGLQFQRLMEARTLPDKTFGKIPPEAKNIMDKMEAIRGEISTHGDNLRSLYLNPPKQIAENQDNSVGELKVGDKFNGEKVVNVKRIK